MPSAARTPAGQWQLATLVQQYRQMTRRHFLETLSLEQLLERISQAGVARQKYPEQLVVVEDFPRTASGKIRKDRLRADIRERLAALQQ